MQLLHHLPGAENIMTWRCHWIYISQKCHCQYGRLQMKSWKAPKGHESNNHHSSMWPSSRSATISQSWMRRQLTVTFSTMFLHSCSSSVNEEDKIFTHRWHSCALSGIPRPRWFSEAMQSNKIFLHKINPAAYHLGDSSQPKSLVHGLGVYSHSWMCSHLGLYIRFRCGMMNGSSNKQMINTTSLTEAKTVAIHDNMASILWTQYFFVAQGYPLRLCVMCDTSRRSKCNAAGDERTRYKQ